MLMPILKVRLRERLRVVRSKVLRIPILMLILRRG
jgi:hypothetical protein